MEKGFYRRMEINTVYFDPAKITVMEMEDALKRAGTYRRTIQGE